MSRDSRCAIRAFAIAAVLLVGACAENPPEQGEVVGARHVEGRDHWHDTSHNQCYAYDKNGTCTFQVWVEDGHSHWHPPRWEIQIEECKERKGPNCRRGWRNFGGDDFAYEQWLRFPVGSHYPDGPRLR